MKYPVGTKLVLHSIDGHDYRIEVVDVSEFRPPEERYGLDMWNDQNVYYGEVYFCGQDFLDKCEVV